ncbi:MAG TPA: response regulator, partial [Usitatibacter sp.]|nr:response regulator [Usitatibacter sp.]
MNDGREAIQAALAFRPDVILLDIGLPGIDGVFYCERLREGPSHTRDLPVIVISGSDEAGRRA